MHVALHRARNAQVSYLSFKPLTLSYFLSTNLQVGYVEQMDIHSSSATVEEALWFSGRLRLPPSVSDAQVRA
jgi:ABC-type multidrug transport system ATPase subunit